MRNRINKSNIIIHKTADRSFFYDCDSFFCDVIYLAHSDKVKCSSENFQSIHSHPSYELQYITGGYCEFELSDRSIVKIKENEFIIFPPNYNHRIVKESENFSKLAAQFRFNPKNNHFYNIAEIIFKTPAKMAASKHMRSFYEIIAAYHQDKLRDLQNAALLSFMSFFVETCHTTVGDQYIHLNESPNNHRTNEAVQFIDNNLSANLTVENVANHIHISKKQLERMFITYLGMTPGKYIRKQRAKKIRELLFNEEYTLENIADMLEYNSISSMIKAFKRVEGITPHLLRRQ